MTAALNPYLSPDSRTVLEIAADAENKIRVGHEALSAVKAGDKANLEKLFGLQVSIARAIYSLERKILDLKKSARAIKQGLRARKDPAEVARLKELEGDAHALGRMIDYGRMVGDSFAWLFYEKDEELLRRHHAHTRIDHAPVGIGGIGEIEFVASFPKLNGRLVLLHSITTFLRIGDFSVINLETGIVEGLGEIKTEHGTDGAITTDISLVGKPAAIAMPTRPGIPRQSPQPAPPAPPAIADRRRRQVKKMQDAYAPKPPIMPERLVSVPGCQLVFNPFPLETLYDAATPERGHVLQFSPGVFFVGIKRPHVSLTDWLFSAEREDTAKYLPQFPQALHPIVLPGSADNSIKIGYLLYYSGDRYTLPFGRTPPMWWPIRRQVIDAMLRHQFHVMTFFNPAFLIARFRAQGYTIEYRKRGSGHLLFAMQPNGVQICFTHLDYFFDMAARQLITEDSIFAAVVDLVENIRLKNFPKDAQVSLSLSFRGAG